MREGIIICNELRSLFNILAVNFQPRRGRALKVKQEAEGRGIIDRCCQLHSCHWLLSIALGRGGREEQESGSGGEAVQFSDGPVGLKRLRAPPEPRRGARGAGLGRVLQAGTSEVRRAPRRQALKKQPPRGRSRFGLAWSSPPTC